ncbi:LysR substrate-binding domain-containing protein [Massilia solisilvae]|uniref:LysR substrate-binding domain-containing protein n=1 Tax=Massilia solisilvae TaxID=1811225 RepID=A0ABT2BF21_9BURK|nr:LysR substrate-binding domain-containing protein [Massilia solisilvae]MCS0607109.1 LysR substrate-binding domain-containing protein [Massilia solisilvae]
MSLPLVRLPSLDLVRGFVAVGRRMSVTLAARDLCLTQSAVSRQVQALEDALGVKLLVRGYRSIAFTPEGERLFRAADGALAQLQDVIHAVKGPSGRRLVTLTSTAGLTGLWLIERLGAFLQAHPDIEVRVSANDRAVDLAAEGIDLAIRYGAREAMPRGAEYLFGESVLPVAHPSLRVKALASPADLEHHTLLQFDGPYRPWLQWGEWFASQGWDEVRPKAVLRFNQYDQLVHAAVAGQGIALGRRPLVAAMLADGRLRAISAPRPGPTTDYAYWLLHAHPEPAPEVVHVMRWIRDEAALVRE